MTAPPHEHATETATRPAAGIPDDQLIDRTREFLRSVSFNPDDHLATLRTEQYLRHVIFPAVLERELVDNARADQGASWADVGANMIRVRKGEKSPGLKGLADKGTEDAGGHRISRTMPLSSTSAYWLLGVGGDAETPEERNARKQALRKRVDELKEMGPEVLPGLTRAEAAARLGVEPKTVGRWAERRNGVRVEEVVARSGKRHKRYFLLDPAADPVEV